MSAFAIFKGSITSELSCYLLQFDGLSLSNPGRSSGGAVLFSPNDRTVVFERGHYIPFATNNQAEYNGLIVGIETAIEMGVKDILIEGDSLLIVQQILGNWKVVNPTLQQFHSKARELLETFTNVGIRHVKREKNAHADALTKEVVQSDASFLRKHPNDTQNLLTYSNSDSEVVVLLKDIQSKLTRVLEAIQ